MNAFDWDWTELSAQIILTFGHFLWQGCLVALALLVVERLSRLPRGSEQDGDSPLLSANMRYNLSCLAFFALPLSVVITFAFVHQTRGPIRVGQLELTQSRATSPLERPASSPRAAAVSKGQPSLETDADHEPLLDPAIPSPAPLPERNTDVDLALASQPGRNGAPYLLAAYILGVVMLLGRFSMSMVASARLRTLVEPIVDSTLLAQIAIQANRLHLRRVPFVALCSRVSVPMVVGIMKPMILLPPALLCGLDPTQIGAILAHEMAHIRRFDLIVNLLQRVVEALLFFHPVTWWLSRRVSVERENCCDDLAVGCVGRLSYADALLHMAHLCLTQQRRQQAALAALAADGGQSSDLGQRVRRLLDARETTRVGVTRRGFAASLTMVLVLALTWVAWGQPPQPKSKSPADVNSGSRATTDTSSLDKDVQWSTWGDRDGLLSGARLILPDGGLKAGQPLIVEYQLANVSKERKTLKCYLPKGVQFASLGSDRCIRGDLERQQETTELTIEPGKTFVAAEHRISIDTTGFEPGNYQVALGSAFRYPDASEPQKTHEIPHRGRISFTIGGESQVAIRPLPKSDIQWGRPIAGLQLGVRFVGDPKAFSIGQTVEADLFVANVSDRTITGAVRLPHPDDGWLFNVEDGDGNTIMLQRPIPISFFSPQRFFPLQLAPSAIVALTNDAQKNEERRFADRRAKFEIAADKVKEENWPDRTIQGRLVTQGGNYSAIFEVTIDRPEIPGLRLSLDSGKVSFTVKEPVPTANTANQDAPKVLDEATNRSILWGEPVKGQRLGIRLSPFAKRRSPLRHGDHLEYEVWLKNESDELLQIARDPRDLYSPRLMQDGAINVVGSGMFLSFGLPVDELAKAELVLPPGRAAHRFPAPYHSAAIQKPGSARGRFGMEPLPLAPGRYPVYAQLGELKSATDDIEILPAARLQVRAANEATEKQREHAAQDPRSEVLEWQAAGGQKQAAIVNWDDGVLLDEDDLQSVEVVPVDGNDNQYSIRLRLHPEPTKWFARRTKMLSELQEPPLMLIMIDGRPLIAPRLRSSIPTGQLEISGLFTKADADTLATKLKPKPLP